MYVSHSFHISSHSSFLPALLQRGGWHWGLGLSCRWRWGVKFFLEEPDASALGTMLFSSTYWACAGSRLSCSTAGPCRCSASTSSPTRLMQSSGAWEITWPSWWIIFSTTCRSVLRVHRREAGHGNRPRRLAGVKWCGPAVLHWWNATVWGHLKVVSLGMFLMGILEKNGNRWRMRH